jgi:two-component system, chemotaxis family, protein-glutamate methylesterase/glutaminase
VSEIGVLVVDDSALMRNLVSRIVDAAPDLTVLGTAMNGQFALTKIPRLNPDVIVLDLEMPEMNGIEFLKARAERKIDIPVVILSSVARKGAQITMEALSLGASEFITKPSGSVSHDIHTVADELTAMLRGYGGAYRKSKGMAAPRPPADYAIAPPRPAPEESAHPTGTAAPPEPAAVAAPAAAAPITPAGVTPAAQPGPLELIVLGISTGGPNALRRLFAEIDGDIGVPMVVVQHMPAGFTSEFAQSLNRVSPLEVKEAAEGDLLKADRVLIAPGDYHITVEKRSLAGVVHLNQNPPQNGHRPSAGALFQSAAKHYGRNVMAVIMTGMGRDGAHEIGEIYTAGGMTIGQDEASSVVYGMPRVARELGYIHRQVGLDEMARVISTLAAELREQR